jgi:hypothetical protein
MGHTTTYSDRLQAEFDEITTGIEAILERAAEEDRDVNDDENTRIERDDARREELSKAIEHYAGIEEKTAKVAQLRGGLPRPSKPQAQAVERAASDAESELKRLFPSPGHYAVAIHRALALRDPQAGAAIERSHELIADIERATAHQITTDNPGIIPRPIVGPVVDRLVQRRPFIASIPNRPAPAAVFDRPRITQHVEVGIQAVEKTLTDSQVLKTVPVPVTLKTHAGHLNISRKDIRWSQPTILGLVYVDFEKIYARSTDKDACADFLLDITQTELIVSLDPTAIGEALASAGEMIGGADDDMGQPDTIWMSRDVASRIGNLRNDLTGSKVYDVPILGGTSGDMEGLRVVVDGRFADGTMVVGDSSLVEWWEDVEGFLSVQEPDVQGQLVGYAGYGAVEATDPAGFVKLTLPAPVGEAAAAARATRRTAVLDAARGTKAPKPPKAPKAPAGPTASEAKAEPEAA